MGMNGGSTAASQPEDDSHSGENPDASSRSPSVNHHIDGIGGAVPFPVRGANQNR